MYHRETLLRPVGLVGLMSILTATGAPLAARGAPLAARGAPLAARGAPLAARGEPASIRAAEPVGRWATERLSFSRVLAIALRHNRDLQKARVDFSTANQDLRAAKGEYDLRLDAGVSFSQSSSAVVEGLNIQRLKSTAFSYNLSVTQKLPTGGSVSLGLLTSRTSDLSRYSFGGSPIENDTTTWDTAITLTVTHPLLKGVGLDRNLAAIRQARLLRDAARWNHWARAQAVVRDLLKAYLDVAEARAAVAVQREAVRRADRELRRVQALLEVGRIAPTELVEHQFAVAQQRRKLLEARTVWLQRSLTLRTMMGRPIQAGRPTMNAVSGSQLLEASEPRNPFGAIGPTSQQAVRAAERSSRALAAAMRELKVKRIAVSVARRDTWPTLDLSASFGPQGRATSFSTAHETMFKWKSLGGSVGLTFSYLVGNRAARAALAKAKLDVKRKGLDIAQMRQTITTEAIRLAATLRLQRKLWQTAEAEARLAALRLQNEKKKYLAGRSSSFVLLGMQNDLVAARHKLFAARVGWLKGRVDLAALMGDLLEHLGLRVRDGSRPRLEKTP